MIRFGIPRLVLALSIAVGTIGLLVMLGWLFKFPSLFRIHPSYPPMPFNVALSLIAAAVGLYAWLREHAPAMRVCAGVLIGIALVALIQILLGWYPGSDELFVQRAMSARSEHPGYMGVSTELCLLLLGAALLSESFPASKARLPYLSWRLCAIVLLLTILSLVTDARDAPYAYAWGEYTQMAILSGIALVLLCAGFISLAYVRNGADAGFKMQRLAILSVAIAGIGLTLLYWYSLQHDDYDNALERFKSDSDHYAHMVIKQLAVYKNALSRQAQRLSYVPGRDARVMEFKSYIDDFPYIDQIQLLGSADAPTDSPLLLIQPGEQRIDTDWITPAHIRSLVKGAARHSVVYEYRAPHVVFYAYAGDQLRAWIVTHVNLDKIANGLIPRSIRHRVTERFTTQALQHIDKRGLLLLTKTLWIADEPIAQITLQGSEEWFAGLVRQSYFSIVLAGLLVTLLLALLVNRNFRLNALHQSLSQLQEIVPVGLLAVDSTGKIVFANRFILDLVGYEEQELVGASIESLVPAELTEHPKWRAGFVKVASSRAMGTGTLEIVHKSTARIPVEIALNITHTAKGMVVMATVINATERARLLAELSEQRNHLENLLDSMGEGVWGLNAEGAISFVNPAACKMLGYETQDELLGQAMHDKVHYKYPDGTDYPHQRCFIHRSLKDGETHEINDEVFWRKDGTSFPVEYISAPVYNETELVGVVVVFHDISQRIRMEQLELEYTQNLERVNQELKEFSYVASHDLQEPLRTLTGYCEFLAEDVKSDDPQAVAKDIHVITNAAKRMQQLIKDLLEYSRSGRAAIDLVPISLNDCLSNAVDNLEHLIKTSNAKVTVGEFPRVLGDATMLTRILQNLLHNAIKFHGDNEPEVSITLVKDGADKITICITDNGIGIDAKYHDAIFMAFKRLHSIGAYEGSGIGLAIVRKIIDKHQGDIWVESTPGNGCKFFITLMRAGVSSSSSAVTAIY